MEEFGQDRAQAAQPLFQICLADRGQAPVVSGQRTTVSPIRHQQQKISTVLIAREVRCIGQIIGNPQRHEFIVQGNH